jgi:uncharacterized protein YegP (UPF0339 family)
MAAKFVIKKKAAGKYHFVLKAGNGEIIATSEEYTTKASAKTGIESIKTNAAKAPIDDETGE